MFCIDLETALPEKTTRQLTEDEVRVAVEWAAMEGWNPGLQDAATFYAADPSAFWGSFLDDELAACVSLTEYGSDYAFAGFFICRPDLRGKGLGYTLGPETLAASRCASFGLDGVVDQQENYKRSGFVYEHANFRYGGLVANTSDIGQTRTFGKEMETEVLSYDRKVFGLDRTRFLRAWLAQKDAIIRVAGEGQVTGWGVARPCQEGTKIGPLFANDAETAAALLADLVAGTASPHFLDVPKPNKEAIALARKAGLHPVFETARMYRGPAPRPDLNRTFGITSFEFG